MGVIVFRVDHLPDLSTPRFLRYGPRATAFVSGALARAAPVLGANSWAGIRYALDPGASRPYERLKIFLVGGSPSEERTTSWINERRLGRMFSGISACPVEETSAWLPQSPSLWVVRSAEELVPVGQEVVSYAPRLLEHARVDPIERFQRLDDVFDHLSHRVIVDALVRPFSVTARLLEALGDEQRFLSRTASGHDPERRRGGTLDELWRHRDPVMARHEKRIAEALELAVSGDVFEVVVRVAGGERSEAHLVARMFASMVGSNESARVVEVTWEQPGEADTLGAMRELRFQPVTSRSELGEHYSAVLTDELLTELHRKNAKRADRLRELSRMTTLCGTEEVADLLQLPVSKGSSFRTIALETEVGRFDPWPEAGCEVVKLGMDLDRWLPVHLTLQQLVKHMLIVGAAGSGKSTTGRGLALEVMRRGVPVLIVEPVKGEYRTLLRSPEAVMCGLRVLTAGTEGLSPFRFNPLEVPPRSTVGEHIYTIKECFLGALPLSEGPMPALLQAALVTVYDNAWCREWQLGEECASFPTLDDLRDEVRRTVDRQEYSSEVKSNIRGALIARLDTLCSLSVGKMFRTVRSSPPLPELLQIPTIIEMERLPGEAKNLFTLILMAHLDRVVRGWGLSADLKLLVLIEEAHNLVGTGRGTLPGVADPKARASELLGKLAAEIRGYGVGLVFIDQSAEAMAGDISKNTTIKVIQRANDSSDIEAAAGFMAMSSGLANEVGRLGTGEGFVYHERLYRPVRVAIEPVPLASSPMSDEELLSVLKRQEWFRNAWLQRTRLGIKVLLGRIHAFLRVEAERARRFPDIWSAADRDHLLCVLKDCRAQAERECSLLEAACGQSRDGLAIRRGALEAIATLIERARDIFSGDETRADSAA